MGRPTMHALDTAAGDPAQGMRVELRDAAARPSAMPAELRTNADNRAPSALLEGDTLRNGRRYHVPLPVSSWNCSAYRGS